MRNSEWGSCTRVRDFPLRIRDSAFKCYTPPVKERWRGRIGLAQGRILNRDMVAWIRHLLDDTTWVPDRQAAADLLATIEYALEHGGQLPGESITPPGLAPAPPMDSEGNILTNPGLHSMPPSPRAVKSTRSKRPTLSLVPLEPSEPNPAAPPEDPDFDEPQEA